MGEQKMCMKLLFHSETNKVLFAEANKDCVDFLFHLMSLPIATVVRLLREQGMVGCLLNLYESIENLNDDYIQPNLNKDVLLKPGGTPSFPLLLLEGGPGPAGNVAYVCKCGSNFYSDGPDAVCREQTCRRRMTCKLSYVPCSGTKEKEINSGFVKGVVTYMVMDDLVVKPMSTVSSLALFNKYNFQDVGVLKEKEVHLGMKEAVKLLKTSLRSKNVLTEVFLTGKIKQ